MENTSQFKNKKKRLFQFDLKGSVIDRKVKTPNKLLKDVNFLEMGKTINIKDPQFLIQMLKKDSDFLF